MGVHRIVELEALRSVPSCERTRVLETHNHQQNRQVSKATEVATAIICTTAIHVRKVSTCLLRYFKHAGAMKQFFREVGRQLARHDKRGGDNESDLDWMTILTNNNLKHQLQSFAGTLVGS